MEPSIDDLFLKALKLRGKEMEQFLNEVPIDRRDILKKLLAANEEAGERQFLSPENPTLPPSETRQQQYVGAFKILQTIGKGGMGHVYMAEQTDPVKRRVALKVIKTDTPTKEILARFEAERQALAMMDHQNIAKVLDAGVTEDGRPYFAMELVKGIPITDYCDRHKLTPKERLELFVQTCRAIQHAHMKGIVHRDIKPSNVLVTLYDDRPCREGHRLRIGESSTRYDASYRSYTVHPVRPGCRDLGLHESRTG